MGIFNTWGSFYFRCVCIVILAFTVGRTGSAQEGWVALRTNEGLVQAEVLQTPGAAYIPTTAREFENGNTFVLQQVSTTGMVVKLILPASLTADLLMEALIKTRIAFSEGAIEVVVVTEDSLESTSVAELRPLPLRELFAVAGATGFYTKKTRTLSSAILPSRKRKSLDRNQVALTGSTHPALKEQLKISLGIPAIDSAAELVSLRETLLLHISPAVPPVNLSFFRTLSEVRTLSKQGNSVVLVSPYLPYARSDKKDQPGVAITGRLVADLIEWAETQAVVFVRAHAAQSEGFFSIPTFHIHGRDTLGQELKRHEIGVVESPDAGFQKDATLLAKTLGVPVGVFNKARDFTTGEARLVSGTGVEVNGLNVAVPDDEIASGGTMGKTAESVKAQGAKKVVGVVTHLTGTAQKALASEALDLLIVTDTNPITIEAHPKLKVISIEPELTQTLKQILRRREAQPSCASQIASS